MSENTLRDSRRKKFFTVDNDTIDAYGARIGVYGFSVYSLLLRYAGSSDTAFPSYQTIGEKFGFSERQAIRTVNLLVEVGLIKKTTRRAQNGATTSNLYTLVDLVPYDTQSPPPMTHSHPPYDTQSPEEEPMKKTQLTKTTSAREVDPKTNQPPRARAKKSNPPPLPDFQEAATTTAKSGWLVSSLQKPILILENVPDPEPTAATEPVMLSADNINPTQSIQEEHPPPPVANGSPSGPATATEQQRSFALLTDSDVGMSAAKALTYATEHTFPWLVAQVATWCADEKAKGTGGLCNRIALGWQPDAPSAAFLRSELYARHYPLDAEQAAEWVQWLKYERLPDHVREDSGIYPPAWLDDLAPDVRELLEELPAPTAGAEVAT